MWRVVAVLCGLLVAGMARPSFGQHGEVCAGAEEVADDARLAACTKAIDAGGLSNRQSATAHFFRGYAWSMKGEQARAIADLTEAVGRDPELDEAWLLRGLNELFLRQYRLAAPDVAQSLKLAPEDTYATLWRYLADVRAEDAWEAHGQLRESWRHWDETLWPGPVAQFLLGKLSIDALRRAARRGDAKTLAGQACEADYYLGQWHLMHGRWDEARALFERAVATCPKNFYEYLGAVAALKPRDAPAPPLDAVTAADRQACMAAEKSPDDRLAACHRAVAAGQLDLYQARGLAFAGKEQWDRAAADYGEAIRRDPKNHRLYAGRGDVWRAKGDTYKAMPEYNAALHLAFDADVYAKRGLEWLGRGINTTAIGDFTRAIELDPRNAELFAHRAAAWEKKGDAEKARADRDKAARLRAAAAQRKPG